MDWHITFYKEASEGVKDQVSIKSHFWGYPIFVAV